jgi:hypothetical protein
MGRYASNAAYGMDYRLRMGEAILQTIQRMGDAFGKYGMIPFQKCHFCSHSLLLKALNLPKNGSGLHPTIHSTSASRRHDRNTEQRYFAVGQNWGDESVLVNAVHLPNIGLFGHGGAGRKDS